MNNSKTFRLFISSTFSDFKKEREVLQKDVFPHIKEYALSKGYTFQPIDLRWGVSSEAQLDQKTLELCLDEVRSCKSYPYPNFLVMLGDRYGWVPLPYAIESKEFEEILNHVNDAEKEKLLTWYEEDLNQLPVSYILRERINKYEKYNIWIEAENELRDILQTAVELSDSIDAEERRKYFLSATEAEVIEGIFSYFALTTHQKKLIDENKSALKITNTEHVFGFFRDIEKASRKSDKFIVDDKDYKKVQEFKKNVKRELTNILPVDTYQDNEKYLDYSYIDNFTQKITDFLKRQIDEQKEIEEEKNFTSLELEKEAQRYFANKKREDFLETDTLNSLFDDISNYIDNKESQKSFIIYGKSGSGKSSLIAEAIEKAQNSNTKKVIYRFVGATPYSSSSKEILTSIFEELGKKITKIVDESVFSRENLIIQDNYESFEEFSRRINDEFNNIDEDVVIFIDAVDQLTNDDIFLWLPHELKSNVKIIISALNDESYSSDSSYFKTLENIGESHKIPKFNEPEKLLNRLLEKDNRTIHKEQMDYFTEQYENVNSPLYISTASQEIKNWKSYDYIKGKTPNLQGKEQSIESSQKKIIKEFVSNLSTVYHHDVAFTNKVLGYIHASKDGLSESELLQLIATDEEFVRQMAPETWHENPTKELPMIHWSRLYTQLKPFLSLKSKDGEELMCFFHREFDDTIEELLQVDNTLKLLHKEMSLFYVDMFEQFWLEYMEQIDGKQSTISIRTYKKLLYHLKKCDDFDSLKYYIGKYLFIYSSIYNVISISEKVDYLSSFDIDYIKDYLVDTIFELNKKHIEYAGAFDPFEPNVFISRGLYQPLYNLGKIFENLRKPNYAIEIYKLTIDKDKQFHNNNYIFIAEHIQSLISIYSELGDIERTKLYCNDMLNLEYPINKQDVYNKFFINSYETFYYKYAKDMLNNCSLIDKNNTAMLYDDFKFKFHDVDNLNLFDEKELYVLYENLNNKKYDNLLALVSSKKNNLDSKVHSYLLYEFNLRIAFDYIQNSNYTKALDYLVVSEKEYLKDDPNYHNYKSFKLLSSIALCMLKEKELRLGEEYLDKAYNIKLNMQDIDTVYNGVFNLAENEYTITVGKLSVLFKQITNSLDELDYGKVLINLAVEEIEKNNLYLHPISIQILLIKAFFLKNSNIIDAIEYIKKIQYYSKTIYREHEEEYIILKGKLDKLVNEITLQGYIV